ncbi:MAG TPA: M24 family metallopeptidase [Steroidobacteraceae bacterium]|nr:M24 family metallopeptidase [Steroidobacteraceae bacterium]
MPSIEEHQKVQTVAKTVLARLAGTIVSTDTELSIANRATAMLTSMGISETWYHSCPAFVLVGSRSCVSISGREYQPSNEPVGLTNLVTVDLSPSLAGAWGDCARSFFIEDGGSVEPPTNAEFIEGEGAERDLHANMRSFVTPETTFHELYEFANAHIRSLGFENLDFLGNLGHSIESDPSERQYIESANSARLGSVSLFTFEPHIRRPGGTWGFKHENIYYLRDSLVLEL